MKKRRAALYFVFVSLLCFKLLVAGDSGDILGDFRYFIDSNNCEALQSFFEKHDDFIADESHKSFFQKELLLSLRSGKHQIAHLFIKNGVCRENLYEPLLGCLTFPLGDDERSKSLELFKLVVSEQLEEFVLNRKYDCPVISEKFLLSLFPPYNDYNKTPFGCTFDHMSEENLQFFCLCFIQAGFSGYANFFKNYLEYRWVFDLGDQEAFLWHTIHALAQYYDHQELLDLFVENSEEES